MYDMLERWRLLIQAHATPANWMCMLFSRNIFIRLACANEIQTLPLILLQKGVTITNVKAHKKPWHALKRESSTNNTQSSNMTRKNSINPELKMSAISAEIFLSCCLSTTYVTLVFCFTISNQSTSFKVPFLPQWMCGFGSLLCLVHLQDCCLLTKSPAHKGTNVTYKTGR